MTSPLRQSTQTSAGLDAILIAGATASGKSRLALSLAQAVNGVIINSDSMQVYRDLRILTARPTRQDEARAPHRLYGILEADDVCSAGRWLSLARREMDAAKAEGRVPIIVGGTGLYFKAAVEGLAHIPDISPEVRAKARAAYESLGPDRFRAEVLKTDPALEQSLAVLDRQRLVRAYEVFLETEVPLTEWQRAPAMPVLSGRILKFVVTVDREELYRRSDARFDRMLAEGALDEVARLQHRDLSPHLPVMKAVGVPELANYLTGVWDLETAREKAQTASRRLVKRQLTWIKSNMIAWNSIFPQDLERLKETIFTFICKSS